jgi:integrase
MAHAKTLSETNFRTLIALLEKESRDLARDRAMVLLSMKAGLRAIEIANLTWGCIREDDSIIELIKTKGGKPRTVPVNKELRVALQAYRANAGAPVMMTCCSKPGTRSPVNRCPRMP